MAGAVDLGPERRHQRRVHARRGAHQDDGHAGSRRARREREGDISQRDRNEVEPRQRRAAEAVDEPAGEQQKQHARPGKEREQRHQRQMRPVLRLGEMHLVEEEGGHPGGGAEQRRHHQPEEAVPEDLAARPHPPVEALRAGIAGK